MNKRLKKLNRIYGVDFPSKDYITFSIGNEIYILSKPPYPTNFLAANIRIYHFGLKIVDDKGRPTYNYAQLFGRRAKDNYVAIDYKEFNKLLKRGYIDKNVDAIIEDKGVNKVKILKIVFNDMIYSIGFVRGTNDKYIFDIPRHFEDLIKDT
jgi:hypothetical protein